MPAATAIQPAGPSSEESCEKSPDTPPDAIADASEEKPCATEPMAVLALPITVSAGPTAAA